MWRIPRYEKGMRVSFRIVAVVLAAASIYLAAALSSGPDATNANLCALLQRIPWMDGSACVPMLGRYVLVAVSIIAAICIIAVIIDVVIWTRSRKSSQSHISEDQEKHSSSQPLDDLDLFQNDLVIRNIWFQIGRLDNDSILDINIDITNRTREPVNFIAVEGNILVSKDNERKSYYKLTEPRLTHHRISQIPPGREFSFILSQEVPSKIVRDWQNSTYYFDFGKLNIIMQSVTMPNKTVRLPLWDGVVVTREGPRVRMGRSYSIGLDTSKWPFTQ